MSSKIRRRSDVDGGDGPAAREAGDVVNSRTSRRKATTTAVQGQTPTIVMSHAAEFGYAIARVQATDRGIESAFGKLARRTDDRLRKLGPFGGHHRRLHEACMAELRQAFEAFEEWRKDPRDR